MTFFHENRRFRLVIDEEGNAIQRSTVDFDDHQLLGMILADRHYRTLPSTSRYVINRRVVTAPHHTRDQPIATASRRICNSLELRSALTGERKPTGKEYR
ncbi:MAG: DUF6522 family protein [Burkholderiales bacterium]